MKIGHGLRRFACSALLAACMAVLLAGTVMFSLFVPDRQATSAEVPDMSEAVKLLVLEIETLTGGEADISLDTETGLVRFLGTEVSSPVPQPATLTDKASPEQAARGFLARYGAMFGVADQAGQLSTVRTDRDADGRSFVRFQQVHNGVPVMGGELIVQVAATGSGILSAGGESASAPLLSTIPVVPSSKAQDKAVAVVARAYGADAGALRCGDCALWIYNPSLLGLNEDRSRLVWRTEVTSVSGAAVRELVLVDATLGSVALHFSQIDTAKSRAVYDAKCTNALPGTLARSEGQSATGKTDVDNAYKYSGYTYDYYYSNHGRDSLDGAGMAIISTVNYDEDGGACDYQNAFWNGSQVVFGPGFPSACDVVGHELTHGVTERESNLFYYMQSGAINESFSDIWGEFTELTYNPGPTADRWLIGEGLSIGAGRDMQDPTAYGQPDWMGSPYYAAGGYFEDGGGVHTNSGVGNKAAYLMVDGGSFNGYTVTGMGMAKTADLFYEVQTNLLTSGSDYADLYNALQQAAINLGYSAADCQTVQDAIDAVEMDQPPASCPASEAPICDNGVPNILFADDMENTGSGNWVSGALYGTDAWGYAPLYATSGQYSLWGYDYPETSDYYVAMTFDVALPAGEQAFLHFRHSFEFDSYLTYYYDGGVVEYSTDGGSSWEDAGGFVTHNGYNGTISTTDENPLGGRSAFVGCGSGFGSTRLELTYFAGQSIRFRFRIGTDSMIDQVGWFIDDFQIYTETVAFPTSVGTLPAADISPTAATLNGELTGLGNRDVVAIDGGGVHSLALCSDGTLWAWGRNDYGQLGVGDTDVRLNPTRVGNASDWVAVSAGGFHSLGLRSDGSLWAWGENGWGQVGLDGSGYRVSPTRVGSATDWVSVSAGLCHSLGVRSDGTLWSWGRNTRGELGLNDTTQRNTPTQVGSATNWEVVDGADYHSLGLRSDGTLWAWGYNAEGELGLNDTTQRNIPTRVGSATDWEAASASGAHSLGLRSGTLWAWGSNDKGQLGLNDTSDRLKPTQVGSAANWEAVCGGRQHSLGLRSDHTLWAWGYNSSGQLGVGDASDRLSPIRAGFNLEVVSAGDCFSLGLRPGGTVWAWGRNAYGELGLGDWNDRWRLTFVPNTVVDCQVWFEWGVSNAYGNATTPKTMTSTGPFSSELSGLSAGTTYYYRAVADDGAGGPVYGAEMSFTTDSMGPYGVIWGSHDAPSTMVIGQKYTVSVSMTNSGGMTWPSGGSNPVCLSYHWYDSNGQLVAWGVQRSAVASDVEPAGGTTVIFLVTAPSAPGSYVLRWDMVQTGVTWFSARGCPTLDVPVTVQPPAYVVAWGSHNTPATMQAGGSYVVTVSMTNAGSTTWPSGGSNPVCLSYHWYDSNGHLVAWGVQRLAVSSDVGPGGSTTVSLSVKAPTAPGSYVLKWDMVQTGITWFSAKGCPTLDVAVTVS